MAASNASANPNVLEFNTDSTVLLDFALLKSMLDACLL